MREAPIREADVTRAASNVKRAGRLNFGSDRPSILSSMRLPQFHDIPRFVPLAALLLCGCSQIASLTSPKAAASASITAVAVVQGEEHLQLAQAGRASGTPVVLPHR